MNNTGNVKSHVFRTWGGGGGSRGGGGGSIPTIRTVPLNKMHTVRISTVGNRTSNFSGDNH